MQRTEIRPRRLTSDVAKAYPFLLHDMPNAVIAEVTGIRGDRLSEAIRGNFRMGYIKRASLEERKARHIENTSISKGGIEVSMRPYFHLDLTTKQTREALKALDGKVYSNSQIAHAYTREVTRHGLQRAKDISLEGQRDKKRSDEELLEIARLRIEVDRVLTEHELEKPKTAKEWNLLSLAARYAKEGKIPNTIEGWRDFVQYFEAQGRVLTRHWAVENAGYIGKNIIFQDPTIARLKQKLDGDVNIPEQPTHRRFLAELLEKAEHFRETGVMSLEFAPYMHLAADEDREQVLRKLTPQIRTIERRYDLRPDQLARLLELS
jgi:hypothetical protein